MVKDSVPKNVSKFPLHQTYQTDDAQPTGTGGYKFKAPEVWSSARSAKKSIAIRSIQWNSKSELLQFSMIITIGSQNHSFDFKTIIPPRTPLNDILSSIGSGFEQWATSKSLTNVSLIFDAKPNELSIGIWNVVDEQYEDIRFTEYTDSSKPPSALNRILNQPLDYFPAATSKITYSNVWDRSTSLHFHASFVPFDNYQYLGDFLEKWYTPIIYQDANTSPLFNVWITTDMKTPLKLLHESFVIRITFIISSESQYHD